MPNVNNNKHITVDQLKMLAVMGKADTMTRFLALATLMADGLDEAKLCWFDLTLPADGWNDREQTVQHDSLLANSNYAYLVCGDADNFSAWSDACIHADNITQNGAIRFHCMATPTADLAVNILRANVNRQEVDTEDEQQS